MQNLEYVILDVETTGFSPKMGDKIIELGALVINENGAVVDEFESLINPHRDLGATWVHNITAEMVKNAPSFEEISVRLLQLLHGRVIVCHNARFDLRFLNHELKSVKQDLEGLCTLDLAKAAFPHLPSYKLQSLAEYFDIGFSSLHSAYEDAKVTKDLFKLLRSELKTKNIGFEINSYITNFSLPPLDTRNKGNTLSRAGFKLVKSEEEDRLKKMLRRLPNNTKSSNLPVQEYLNILEDALSDRIVTEEEAVKLFELANYYGISSDDIIDIHEEYLRRLIRVYLLDQIISNAEYEDLVKVSKLLGVYDKLNLIIDLEKSDIGGLLQKEKKGQNTLEGRSVCFTGQLLSKFNGKRIERSFAQELAVEKGLIVKKSVTKKLDILVVADPHTASSKAQKAREYGIKIIAEPVFWKMIGVHFE